jgi:hypothetical protein
MKGQMEYVREPGCGTETAGRVSEGASNAGQLANSQLHPEGPATSLLDQGFPWYSLVPEQMLSWYPNST